MKITFGYVPKVIFKLFTKKQKSVLYKIRD